MGSCFLPVWLQRTDFFVPKSLLPSTHVVRGKVMFSVVSVILFTVLGGGEGRSTQGLSLPPDHELLRYASPGPRTLDPPPSVPCTVLAPLIVGGGGGGEGYFHVPNGLHTHFAVSVTFVTETMTESLDMDRPLTMSTCFHLLWRGSHCDFTWRKFDWNNTSHRRDPGWAGTAIRALCSSNVMTTVIEQDQYSMFT